MKKLIFPVFFCLLSGCYSKAYVTAWRTVSEVQVARDGIDSHVSKAVKSKHIQCVGKHGAKSKNYDQCIDKHYVLLKRWVGFRNDIVAAEGRAIAFLQRTKKDRNPGSEWTAGLRRVMCDLVAYLATARSVMNTAAIESSVIATITRAKWVCK